MVPWIAFFSDVVIAMGSGMTVKFFPLYFKNDLKLCPVAVQSIYLILPLMMAALSGISERAARSLGRVPVVLLFRGLGICLLVTMALLEAWAAPDDPFVGTNATQNATLSNGLFCFTNSGGANANSTAPAASELSARLWWRHAGGEAMPPAWAAAKPRRAPAPQAAARRPRSTRWRSSRCC